MNAADPNAARVLFISNGHGEDEIAGKVLDRLRKTHPVPLQVAAWPMVGAGAAYRKRNVEVIGPSNTLPGEGFGTLSPGAFLRDLRHGFIRTHWRQARFARGLREQYPLIIGCGDIIPLAAGVLASTRMAFISCAKSAYYDGQSGHTLLERSVMQRNCAVVFPRDGLTAQALARAAVSIRDLGNPMMDDLASSGAPPLAVPPSVRIALLAGSRQDAVANIAKLLAAAARLCAQHPDPQQLRFLCAVYAGVDLTAVQDAMPGRNDWQPGQWDSDLAGAEALALRHTCGAKALLIKHRFADVLHASDLAVGMAGTANEQAVGLGLPLVSVPGTGNQGQSYARMKMRFYGGSAVAAAHDPCDIASKVQALLSDPARCAVMAQAGHARMGGPGASAAIAAEISGLLMQSCRETGGRRA